MSYFKCFKYRAVNKNLIDSLVHSTLYFSPRENLNDPFDSQIDVSKIIESLLNGDIDNKLRTDLEFIQSKGEFFSNFERGYKDFGICSFATELENTLMWSHYADEHRGIVLLYDMPREFLDNPEEILGVSQVAYKENTISHWLRENAHKFEKDHFEFVTGLLKVVITAKSPEWGYENEGRIIRPRSGAYEAPRSILKGITFGLRTSEKDEKLIRSIAEKYYQEILFSRIVRTGSDFGIHAEEFA